MTTLTLSGNEEICEIRTGAFNAHDLDRLADVLADDIVFHAPGVRCGHGKTTCLAFYEHSFADFPDAELRVINRQVSGGVAVEEGRFVGSHTGRAATGRTVELDYVQVSCVRDGEQVLLEMRFDRQRMLEQLGLLED